MKPSQEQINDLLAHGVVPGATVACAMMDDTTDTGNHGVVMPVEWWVLDLDAGPVVGLDGDGSQLFGYTIRHRRYATVITPAHQPEQPIKNMKYTHIKLNQSEIQSGVDRVRWAEGLIRQLPEDHDGRNSWLLNYAGDKHTASKVVIDDQSPSVTPKPAEQPKPDPPKPTHALRDGDYVIRTDKAMHDRLMALCDVAGVEVQRDYNPRYESLVYASYNHRLFAAGDCGGTNMRELTEAQFVAALFGKAPVDPVEELTLDMAKELLRNSRIYVAVAHAKGWDEKLSKYGIR